MTGRVRLGIGVAGKQKCLTEPKAELLRAKLPLTILELAKTTETTLQAHLSQINQDMLFPLSLC